MPHWDDERDGLVTVAGENLMLDTRVQSGIFREYGWRITTA